MLRPVAFGIRYWVVLQVVCVNPTRRVAAVAQAVRCATRAAACVCVTKVATVVVVLGRRAIPTLLHKRVGSVCVIPAAAAAVRLARLAPRQDQTAARAPVTPIAVAAVQSDRFVIKTPIHQRAVCVSLLSVGPALLDLFVIRVPAYVYATLPVVAVVRSQAPIVIPIIIHPPADNAFVTKLAVAVAHRVSCASIMPCATRSPTEPPAPPKPVVLGMALLVSRVVVANASLIPRVADVRMVFHAIQLLDCAHLNVAPVQEDSSVIH